jgi:hypothetical protein
VWQELRSELHPRGLEVVTVALEVRGLDNAGRWIEAAAPEHPSLIDSAHVVDELFGIVNVPSGVWIDEAGMIVRPPETAFPNRLVGARTQTPPDPDPYAEAVRAEVRKIRIEPDRYVAALRDWVDNGAASRFALASDEVVRRSGLRSPEVAQAAAHFELGQHLHRSGHPAAAVPHFRQAHSLQPENWTYKRQAWTFADPLQGPTDVYESDWLTDVRKIGAANYYPSVELD